MSSKIGTGHFMRCLTLAEALKVQGAQIRFLCRNLPTYLIDLLNIKDIEHIALVSTDDQELGDDLAHSGWLGTSQAQDAKATIQALADQSWDWIVVDHYALDERWERAVRKSCTKLMVIDDLADRHHDCEVLIDQNYYSDMQSRYIGKVPKGCQLLLGPRYALLREEFRKLRTEVKPHIGDVKRILVFFGGIDVRNYTAVAIKALKELNIKLHIDVVIGAQHPHCEQIQNACIAYGFILHVQTSSMAKLISEADLAIGAGGSASWERCCLGLPTLTIAVAENQINIAKSLGSIGACCYLGEEVVVNSHILQHAINKLLLAPGKIRLISQQALLLVDGLGTSRASQVLGF
ncbi:UDP-2,4-diacetamido-2,4,6-trideoxy-beta-L-altropyranose hydrolase [Polynucleobacter paneuropaeus]|nr:UDP-2,4-diacetamido-2,4,6-trideoxy-beta-L-altropyranose hydrolase [Polynucleobacter paneuropaeus]